MDHTPNAGQGAGGIATPEEVLRTITQIMRGEAAEEGAGPPKVSERSRAAEMLGKRYGLFGEKETGGRARPEIADEIDAALEELIRPDEPPSP